MAQQLRALDTLTEDRGLLPSPTWWLTVICNSNYWGSDSLSFDLQWHHTHTWCIHTHAGKHQDSKNKY